MQEHDKKKNVCLFGKFDIIFELAMEDNCQLYLGKDIENGVDVLIKEKTGKYSLKKEAYRLVHLQGKGIPKLYLYGNIFDDSESIDNEDGSENNELYKDYIISEDLGKNLQYFFNQNDKHFLMGTICNIAIQCIKLLEYIHEKSFIHRDINPDIFYIGKGKANSKTIYLTNFFYAKQYYTKDKGHLPKKEGKKLIKHPDYCSINALEGKELSRKDDMESLGYVLAYFYKGSLPWFNIKGASNDEIKKNLIEQKKKFMKEEVKLNYPPELYSYFNKVKKLKFADKPNYQKLISIFEKFIVNNNLKYDLNFTLKEAIEEEKSPTNQYDMNTNIIIQEDLGKEGKTKKKGKIDTSNIIEQTQEPNSLNLSSNQKEKFLGENNDEIKNKKKKGGLKEEFRRGSAFIIPDDISKITNNKKEKKMMKNFSLLIENTLNKMDEGKNNHLKDNFNNDSSLSFFDKIKRETLRLSQSKPLKLSEDNNPKGINNENNIENNQEKNEKINKKKKKKTYGLKDLFIDNNENDMLYNNNVKVISTKSDQGDLISFGGDESHK